MLHNQRALRHLPMLFILLLLTPPRQPHEDGPAYHPGVCILSLGGPAIIRFTRKKAEEATPEEAPPPGQTAMGGVKGMLHVPRAYGTCRSPSCYLMPLTAPRCSHASRRHVPMPLECCITCRSKLADTNRLSRPHAAEPACLCGRGLHVSPAWN